MRRINNASVWPVILGLIASVALSATIADDNPAQLDRLVNSERPPNAEANLLAQVPDLKIVGWTIADSVGGGNGDGVLHPGETAYLKIWLSNQGNETARYVDGRLYEVVDHPDVEILDKFAAWPDLLGTGLPRVSLAPHFRIQVASTRPCNWEIALRLELTADDGYMVEREFTVVLADPREIDLADKSARPFYYGPGPADDFGWSMASGDFNGDGYDDLLVGAPGANGPAEGKLDAGEVVVIYGGSPPRRDRDLTGSAYGIAFVYGADAGDQLGSSVASGDINGDGYDDLVLGAEVGDGHSGAPRNAAGEVAVIYGSSTIMTDVDLATEPGVAFIYGASEGAGLGHAVATGDLNGDGYDDIIAGADTMDPSDRGGVAVIYGGPQPLPGNTDLALSPSWAVNIGGRQNSDRWGSSVAAGDLNGDGYDDLIATGYLAGGPDGVRTDSGQAAVIYGGPDRWFSFNLSSEPSWVAFIYGRHSLAYLGYASATGDLDGDGYDDLILGAPGGADPSNGAAVGHVAVIYGGPAELQDIDLASATSGAVFVYGEDENDLLGVSVATGDLDSDGYDDIIAGAYSAGGPANGRSYAGEAVVAHGRRSRLTDIDLGSSSYDTWRVYGVDADDRLGHSVVAADLDKDGYDDLVVGSMYGSGPDNLSGYVGEVAVIPGGSRSRYRHDPDAYAFIDATAGTALSLGCDDCAVTIPIGFDFYFYGQPHDEVTVSSNGYLTFGGPGDHLANRCLPVANPPNDVIAVFWDDLNLETGGDIYYLLEGTAPNRRLTVEWHQVPRFPAIDAVTFEVTLFESSNQILFQYQDVYFGGTGADQGATAVIGVENGTGRNGTPLSCFRAGVDDGQASRWRPYGNPTLIWSDDMESGVGGWTSTGLWHRVAEPTCSPSSRSGTYSWYYGQDSTCNYDTGAANAGTLTSETISGLAQDAELSFWHRRDAESFGLTDSTTVELQADGAGFDVLESVIDIDNTWIYVPEIVWFSPEDHRFSAFDLTAYTGQDVELRFAFDTVDDFMNIFLGWMVDDVEIRACPVWDSGAAAASGVAAEALATPQPETYCEGSIGRLDALGSYCAACPTLTYQWSEGGTPIPGAMGVTYTIPPSQIPDRYDFTVEIACATNPACGDTSNVASVDIVQRPSEVGSTLVASKTAGGTELEFHWSDTSGATSFVLLSDTAPSGAFATEAGSSASGTTGVTVDMPTDEVRFYLVAGSNPICGVGPR